jgi:predicted  nucleic acid-binding Zn-ribbon protein
VNEGDAEQLASRLESAIAKIPARENEDEQQRLAAAVEAAERLSQLLQRVPWVMIPPGWLEQIEAAFDPVVAAAESFSPDEGGEAGLPITWTEIERLWASLTPLLTASIPEESVAEDAASFRRSIGQMNRRLTEEVQEARTEVRGLRAQLRSVANERDEALGAIKEQQAALETTINEQAARLNEAIQSYNTAFSSDQDQRRSDFTGALEEYQRTLNQHIEDSATAANQQLAKVGEEAGETLVRIRDMEEKATASYATIGGSSVARYFQDDANKEQVQADRWRLAAVVALLLVAIGTIVELAFSNGTLEWDETRSRIPLAVAIFLFAGFAAREAQSHRKAARESRGHEVKVSSIDPYLKLVEDQDEAERVKIEYARTLFVKASGDGDAQPPAIPGDE